MSELSMQNPFAPPLANVEDPAPAPGEMVDASRGARLLAVLIDIVAIGGPIAILGGGAAVALPRPARSGAMGGSMPAALIGAELAGGLIALAFIICNAVLVHRYGQTLGKKAMGIRVVRGDGGRVGFARFVFLRWGVLTAASMVPVVGGLVGLIDPLLIFRDSRRCLHDNIADTKVVTAASSPEATLAGAGGAHLPAIRS